MESLVTLVAVYDDLDEISPNTQPKSHPSLTQASPKPPWPRQLPLDLPLDLEGCHGKFGDASYYRG
jgi:hypothetical protein